MLSRRKSSKNQESLMGVRVSKSTFFVLLTLCSCLGGGQETPPSSGPHVTCGQQKRRCELRCIKTCVSDLCENNSCIVVHPDWTFSYDIVCLDYTRSEQCRSDERPICIESCSDECADAFEKCKEDRDDEMQ